MNNTLWPASTYLILLAIHVAEHRQDRLDQFWKQQDIYFIVTEVNLTSGIHTYAYRIIFTAAKTQ